MIQKPLTLNPNGSLVMKEKKCEKTKSHKDVLDFNMNHQVLSMFFCFLSNRIQKTKGWVELFT